MHKIGFGGSYARGDWGFGSDVDLVVVLTRSSRDFFERGREFDATSLPVQADVLVYTEEEWERSVLKRNGEVVWVAETTERPAGD